MKAIILLFILTSLHSVNLGLPPAPEGPGKGWQCALAKAYAEQDMQQWLRVMLDAERVVVASGDKEALFDISLALYGYVGYLLREKKKAEARVYLKKMETYTAKLGAAAYQSSRVEALQIAAIAFHMALDPTSVMRAGPKLMKKINQARQKYQDCPYIFVEAGNADFHRPAMWGGSYKKAAANYRAAVALFKKSGEDPACNWFYQFLNGQLRQTEKLLQ